MPDSFQGTAVIVAALLPGGLYTWAFERQVGRWGISLTDRLLRFVGFAALVHALAAPATYAVYRAWLHSGDLGAGRVSAWAIWGVALAYVLLPTLAGVVVGIATRKRSRWATWITGRNPAPRAWDYFFSTAPKGYVRLKLKGDDGGGWIAGTLGERPRRLRQSYSAGYPEKQDLYLAETFEVDDDGDMLTGDGNRPIPRGSGVLLDWSEVAYLEFDPI
ncbi:MAG: DUF6338 family protein [Mycobacteriales bacterium]|nr:DUF6338 family protein [Frankia sp.]